MGLNYIIVRYMPDPLIGECVNIGVVARDEDGKLWTRFLEKWDRVRQFARGQEVDFLLDFVKEAVDYPWYWWLDLRNSFNCITCSEPRSSVLPVDLFMADNAHRFLVE